MKKRPTIQAILISTLCVSLLSTSLFLIPGANAELATPSSSSTSAPLATEEQYCDSVCPSIANSNGQLLGLSGQPGWTATDDQWCANHNSQTNPAVMASPAPLGASVPTDSCTISYYPGDTSCAQVTAGFNRCQYKNSQVESYCEAYESAKMAGAGEEMVLLLDIAATATCGAACAIEMSSVGEIGGAGVMAKKACDGAAIGAGAAEILVTLTQQSSAMGKIADAALGAAGIVEGIKGLASGTNSCRNESPLDSLLAFLNPIKSAEALNFGVGNYMPKSALTNQTSAATGGSQKPSKCSRESCITAITMAALTGVRYYNDGYGKRTKASACNSIWGLQSSASAIAGGISAAGYTASGGSNAAASGSSVGSSGTTAGTSAASGLNCMANGGTVASCSSGQVSAATDGGILGNSGLGNAVAPLAQQLANSGALGSGGSLGSAMGGAMQGAGDMGNALTKIAETAAANGKELGQVASMGGGGGGGGGTASDTNGLANLFANSGPAAVAAPMQVFKGDSEDSDDIWHSHSSSNIFQIVSHRIGKVNP